jgi:SAM-dependent methyltransferase
VPERGPISSPAERRLFGLDPAGYASGRPPYPERIFELLAERCGLAEGTPTLEIGPGPGRATASLLARGARPLVAVEPDAALAAFLRDRFGERVAVVQQPFEEAELPEGGFTLAASATAFHWIEQERGLAQVARALEPGGWWAAWWMAHHDPDAPDDLYRALEPLLDPLPAPRAAAGDKGKATPGFPFDRDARVGDLERTGVFDRISVDQVRTRLTLDPARARALFGTFSPLLALEPDERERVLDAIERVIVEQFGGRFERTNLTILYTARRV